jgi:hypothetical protein
MTIEYSNFYNSKALKNLPKHGFLFLKHTIWQPCQHCGRGRPTRVKILRYFVEVQIVEWQNDEIQTVGLEL